MPVDFLAEQMIKVAEQESKKKIKKYGPRGILRVFLSLGKT